MGNYMQDIVDIVANAHYSQAKTNEIGVNSILLASLRMGIYFLIKINV